MLTGNSDYRAEVLAAAAYNQTPEFKADMKQRPWVERVIFEVTHYCGGRHCRRIGLEAADWQSKMSGMAYNLKLWTRKASRQRPAAKAKAEAEAAS